MGSLSHAFFSCFNATSHELLHSLSYLPAVFLGLILNLLDAMSYGYIIFPISNPMFSDFGSDGISMYLVSTFISQIVYGIGSEFRGGNGSMMIEVIPFLHSMVNTIAGHVADERQILPTIMVCYALSSVMTGLVFFLLGLFKLGNIVGFFPRIVLVGTIGGVGYFLIQTALEVTSRTQLSFTLACLRELFSMSILPLWSSALAVALLLRALLNRIHHPLFVPCFFLFVPFVFYIVVFSGGFDLSKLREKGWLFDIPEEAAPFYNYFTFYRFGDVQWGMIPRLMPTMLSLTFFGVLHVPINVPALAVSTRTDISVNRELITHGFSNMLSGLAGSVQNYLVYSNSVLFYKSGGDSRVASLLLAAATIIVWFLGSTAFSYVPTVVVGSLIFHLGLELMKEALYDTWSSVGRLEYFIIIVIVLSMASLGFTEGIFVGIMLACLFFVVSCSKRGVIRSEHTGESMRSSVRRVYRQYRYLNSVGSQIHIIKLQGFMFFGTIHQLDKRIKHIVSSQTTTPNPIRYLILDMHLVTDLDFSAAEGFIKIQNMLEDDKIYLVLSGVKSDRPVGKALRKAGVWQGYGNESIGGYVRCFDDLNSSLEWCENCLLEVYYLRLQDLGGSNDLFELTNGEVLNLENGKDRDGSCGSTGTLDVPTKNSAYIDVNRDLPPAPLLSPRNQRLHEAASFVIEDSSRNQISTSSTSAQPQSPNIPVSDDHAVLFLSFFEQTAALNALQQPQDIEVFMKLIPYFTRTYVPAGTVLWLPNDSATELYVVESGVLNIAFPSSSNPSVEFPSFKRRSHLFSSLIPQESFTALSSPTASIDSDASSPTTAFDETILPGTFVGEVGFLAASVRQTILKANTNAVLYKLTYPKYLEAVEEESKIATVLPKLVLGVTMMRVVQGWRWTGYSLM
ncbi:sulfate transporter family-domain-containing protein [Paraphysoderma sedebokerense]|nr:sulfate transporter family-domain-containing protein [Paraphysoderma sedebokerense]